MGVLGCWRLGGGPGVVQTNPLNWNILTPHHPLASEVPRPEQHRSWGGVEGQSLVRQTHCHTGLEVEKVAGGTLEPVGPSTLRDSLTTIVQAR